tara:strand:- start:2845 stop:3318 length:474 start_codon:yes stop_codon:yes gene_type:complete
MKATILLSFFLFVFSLSAAEEKKVNGEKSYTERLKEAYDEKVKAGKELYDKGVKGAKEKYGVGLEDGKKLTTKSKEWLMKDIENIGDWEYKVVSYGSKDFQALEKDLNELGKERWQCFWVEAAGEGKVFYFKRTKMSYLSKIPAGALLRIIADFQNN